MKKIFFALMIILVQLHPVSAYAACTSTKASGSVKVGSQITGNSVVVCASSSSSKTAVTVKTPAPVKKTVTPVKVVPPPCVIRVSSAAAINDPRVPGCSYVVVAPAKPVVAAPKPAASAASAATAATDQAAFTPNPVGISTSADSGLVGQSFLFSANASAHSRTAKILGQSAQVNFDPISFEWTADDGSTGSGASFSASWSSEGSHSIGLTVNYSVSYSFGSGWTDAGVISSTASTNVSVSSIPQTVASRPAAPVLVSGNCYLRPGSYRC